MEYVAHNRYRGISLNQKQKNIPYGTKLNLIGEYIFDESNDPICYVNSEIAHIYFSRNDDGNGLERGEITYAFAYKQRKAAGGFRFSESEIEKLLCDWNKYLRPLNVILFTNEFFNAPIEDLRTMKGEFDV